MRYTRPHFVFVAVVFIVDRFAADYDYDGYNYDKLIVLSDINLEKRNGKNGGQVVKGGRNV